MTLTDRARAGVPFVGLRRRNRPAGNPYRKLNRRLLWMAPLGTMFVIFLVPFYLDKMIAATAGVLALTVLARKPGTALRWLICFLPVYSLLFSYLYKIGLPGQLVRPMGYWKEAMIVALVVGAILGARKYQIRMDGIDIACLAFCALSFAYLALPDVFVDGLGARLQFGNRLQGFRSDGIYILLFLAARHCRIPGREVLRAVKAFGVISAGIAVLGIVEYFDSSWWNDFVINKLGYSNYKIAILHVDPAADRLLNDIRVYTALGGRMVLRVGGVFINYEAMAFALAVAACFLAELQVRRGVGRKGWVVVALPLTISGVILSQTRSGLLVVAAALIVVVSRLPGREVAARVRMTLVVGAMALLALPFVLAIGLGSRLAGEDTSNSLHVDSTQEGLSHFFDHPLGTGFGTGAGAGQRNGLDVLVSENQFLQIGNQLGIVGLLLWLGSYGSILYGLDRGMRRHADKASGPNSHPAAAVVAGARTVFIAFVPAFFFLQPLTIFPASWPMFALAGASLGSLEAAPAGDEEDESPYSSSLPQLGRTSA